VSTAKSRRATISIQSSTWFSQEALAGVAPGENGL
jgi:hypothetical protein